MCGTHLQDHLLLVAQVERLQMARATEFQSMDLMSILATEGHVWLPAMFAHVRCAPFATQQGIEPQMPPKIVLQKLRAAVHLPLAQDLERLAIEHENTSRPVAIGSSKRADINTFRSTVNRVRTRIISTCKNFFRFDYFDDLRFSRIGLRVDNVNARRAQSRHDKVTAFNVRMRRIRAERRAARVPTKMM